MAKTREELIGEIRYAERLCMRTARLYRRLQSIGTFLTVLGGSGVVAAASSNLMTSAPWLPVAGTLLLAVFGALLVAIRPADKAAANETDVKRYAQLRTKAADTTVTDAQLEADLNKARESDAAEVEPLREVAWNDVAKEIGAEPAVLLPLRPIQRVLSALA